MNDDLWNIYSIYPQPPTIDRDDEIGTGQYWAWDGRGWTLGVMELIESGDEAGESDPFDPMPFFHKNLRSQEAGDLRDLLEHARVLGIKYAIRVTASSEVGVGPYAALRFDIVVNTAKDAMALQLIVDQSIHKVSMRETEELLAA